MAARRQDLFEAYRHPYLRWLPLAWAREHVARDLGGAVVLTAAVVIWDARSGAPPEVVVAAVAVALLALVHMAWVTLVAARDIRERSATWRMDRSELANVRHRPEVVAMRRSLQPIA